MGALTRIASLLVLVAAWQAAALEAGSRLLPAPLTVLRFIVQEAERGDLVHNVGVTLLRVAISFTVAMGARGRAGRRARAVEGRRPDPRHAAPRPAQHAALWSSRCWPMSGSG